MNTTITATLDLELTPRARATMEALHKALSPQFQSTEPSAPTVNLQPGERYAGVVLDEDGKALHHLVLLPQRPEKKLDWQDAMNWATSAGGHLPTRQEQALLFANCKPHLEPVWHWSCETHADDASYAWYCDFDDGNQNDLRKSCQGAAVAVRRV